MADPGRLPFVFLTLGFLLTTYHGFSASQESPASQKQVKAPKLSAFAGPTLKFMFWKVFEQYAQALHERFPTLMIVGDNYPPPVIRATLAQALGIIKFILIGLVVIGFNPFPLLNLQTPSVYSWATDNKLYACLMLFFVANAIESQLISTGAFEISFNDVPIWSKLETGRIPSPSEMVQMIENNMRFLRMSDDFLARFRPDFVTHEDCRAKQHRCSRLSDSLDRNLLDRNHLMV